MEEEYQVLIQENCRYGSGHLAQIPPPLVVEFFLGLDIRIDRTVEPMLCLHGCIPLTEHELQPQDQFLIFASDGLWEQLSNYQEDVDIVQNHPRNVCVRPIFPQIRSLILSVGAVKLIRAHATVPVAISNDREEDETSIDQIYGGNDELELQSRFRGVSDVEGEDSTGESDDRFQRRIDRISSRYDL
ncbi:BnaA09g25020D [Brassica napus]|uniref:BnaA09g25020D protein n=1 Tax=Brassica napus TaxID=3708 RepID=A0A078FH62_BRANA|nr:BnaA09g25020D [Brassica napus]